MNKAINRDKIVTIIGYLILALSVIGYFYCCIYKARGHLDSDMSSEMVLASILKRENQFIATNKWIYSTEFRFINMQVIFTILMRITQNWFYIRSLGNIISLSIMIAFIFLLCKEMNVGRYFPYVASAFLLPLQYDTIRYTYIGLWYMYYLIYTIVILFLFFRYQRTAKVQNLIVAFICSTLICIQGSRLILTIVLPILFACLFYYAINRKFDLRNFLFPLTCLFGGLFGYLINRLYISKKYIIGGDFSFKFINNLGRIKDVFKAIFENYGYNASFFSFLLSIVLVLFIVLCFVISFKKKKDNRNSFLMNLIFVSSLLGLVFVLFFTSIELLNRYLYLGTILLIPSFFCCIDLFSKKIGMVLLSVFMFVFLFIGASTYINSLKIDNTSELDQIVNKLEENDCKNGYSLFWSSNILTELSNGQIEVWCWGDTGTLDDNFREVDEIYWWLQDVEHANKTPKEKVFILLTNEQNERFKDLVWFFTEKDVLLRTNNYILYCFNSYEDMKQIMRIG